MAVLGVATGFAAWLLGFPGVARGAVAGAALAAIYLAVLWRYVRAFVAQARGERPRLLDLVILRGGMGGRLLMAGGVLALIARNHPWINLWAAILTFLSYRVLMGLYEIWVLVRARREPIPPPLGWRDDDDRFDTREKRDIGRRRSRHQGR
ncbi:MAG: hypothetical protein FJZ01_02420 [Candidatus Sericytochromatia bacterium]|nr:hypothetical protein [Candidatus Tanganyikabacteria bacterium]